MAKKVLIKAVVSAPAKAKPLPLPPPPPAAPRHGAVSRPPAAIGGKQIVGKGLKTRPTFDHEGGGEEHRQFPRAKMSVPFLLWIGDGDARTFSATLHSANISVSGAFLESTFFLPVNTELRVSFNLDDDEEPVQARALVYREERLDRSGKGRSGMAIRFLEFFGQTEVTLARLFLGVQLTEFAERYLQSKRARSLTSELDRVVDAMAAWELIKVTTPGDPWGPTEQAPRR